MAEERSFLYALGDNVVGFEDDYDSLGERGARALREDPVGILSTIASSLKDSAVQLGRDVKKDPLAALNTRLQDAGETYYGASKNLTKGLSGYLDQGLSVEEARDQQLVDALTVSELLGMGFGAKALTKAGSAAVKKTDRDEISDSSRRKFMKGVGMTGIAALAPQVVTEALEKVPAAVKILKPVPNPIDIFSQNIKILRREMEEAYDAADDLPFGSSMSKDYDAASAQAYNEAIQNAEKLHYDLDATTEMDLRELISEIGPKQIAEAADESLEEISQALTDFRMVSEDEYIKEMIPLAEEIKRRGLLEVKDGRIFEYPYAKTVVDDVDDYLRGVEFDTDRNRKLDNLVKGLREQRKPTDLKMTEGEDLSTEDIIKSLQEATINRARTEKIKELKANTDFDDEKINKLADAAGRRAAEEIAARKAKGKETNKSVDFITYKLLHNDVAQEKTLSDDNQKTYERLKEKYGPLPIKRMNGGEMRKGVGSLNDIARNMTRGPKGIGAYEQFSSGGDVSGPPPIRGPDPQGFSKGGEGVIIPTKEDLDNMVVKVRDRYGFDPIRVATQEGVDPELALRIMFRESSGDHEKGSEKGAIGLMQLMPITAEDVDVDRTDPYENYVGGLRYLKKMQARFGPVDGIAAYNAGPTAVEKYEGIPPFAETQNYVRAVLSPFTGIDYEDQIQDDAETALMQMPVEVASNPILRPQEKPPIFYTGPRPTARPEPQQMPVSPPMAPQPMPMDQNLQAKYSPQGIEQMLIGTTGGLPLPTPSPQGLPYSSMR